MNRQPRLGLQVLERMHRTGSDPTDIIAAGGLNQTTATVELDSCIAEVISRHPDAVTIDLSQLR